jgi:metal-responsive CopG/Arc/MetJ family transcriptional regulator
MGFAMKNGNGGKGLIREERLQIMLSPQELQAVDNFRFAHRMPSRAAAIRELLRHGLAAAGTAAGNTGVKSRDYGVLTGPTADRDA